MRKKIYSMLALLMVAVTGAWAQRLYLEVNGTAATLKYSANEADYSGKPSFTGTMWQNASGFKASVETITVDASCENFAGDKLQGLFAACSVLTSVTGLGTINTEEVTDMTLMFNGCSALTSVDFSGFNTANVTTMQKMFYNCSSLETVDLSGFNTANVTDMKNMFYNCSSMETVDLSSFNTSSVTNMSYMFSSCTGLKSVNFSGLNTSGVTTMTYMFQGCRGLQTLDLSDLNTSSVTDMRNMFQNCTGLQTLDISSFNTGNVTKMGSMFNGCSQLTAIFVGNDWRVASSANSMFTDCTNLPNWDGTSDGTKAYYGGDGKGYLTYKVDGPPASTYTVTLKEGTEDATSWTIAPAEATTTGVAAGTEVKATYGGAKKVKSVKAVKKAAAPAAAEGHPLSASEVGEIVCSDGLAYAAADKDNLPTGVTAVAIVAYLGDGDTSDNTYNHGLAIAMSDANGGSKCQWFTRTQAMNCVSGNGAIATAIGYKDGIGNTNTLTTDGHTHAAATAAASNNGIAAPTGTSGWFLPSMGQWNLIVQGLASKKAGSAVTTDISGSGNDTYKASNLNSVITAAGGTGFVSDDYHSSTQSSPASYVWVMQFGEGGARDWGLAATNYVRSVLAF